MQSSFDFQRDPTAAYHGGDPESTAAHDSVRDLKTRMHRRILAFGASRGPRGMTCDEAEMVLGMTHQTCSARFTELKASGQIRATDRKRTTRSGRRAKVYVVNWERQS